MKKLTKKEKKQYKYKKEMLYEMALLLPAFTYMYTAIKEARKAEQKTKADIIAEHTTSKLIYILGGFIRQYDEYAPEATDIANQALNIINKENNIGSYLLSLNILFLHSDINNEKIVIEFKDNYNDLLDYAIEMYNKDFKYLELVESKSVEYSKTIQRIIENNYPKLK